MPFTDPAPPCGTQDHAARSGTVADGSTRTAPQSTVPNLADLLGLAGLWSGEAYPAPTPSGVEHVHANRPLLSRALARRQYLDGRFGPRPAPPVPAPSGVHPAGQSAPARPAPARPAAAD